VIAQPNARVERPELGLVAALLALAGLSWWAAAALGDSGMRLGVLTGGEHGAMHGEQMSMALPLFLVTWTVMMAAMMLPAAAPVVLVFRRWAQSRDRAGTTTAAFVAGYLAVWSAIGVAAWGLLQLLDAVVPSGDVAVRVGGGLLVAAGVYQLTPLKEACLTRCRSPLSFIVQHAGLLQKGHGGPFRAGVVHGGYCVGCCWMLFVVLALLGMMNVAWMALLAAVIVLEKATPWGGAVGRIAGGALVVLGVVVLVWPEPLPAL